MFSQEYVFLVAGVCSFVSLIIGIVMFAVKPPPVRGWLAVVQWSFLLLAFVVIGVGVVVKLMGG